VKQHLVIHQALQLPIQPKHHIKESQVRTLCCIPRGPVKVEAWMDKNAYVAGEVSQIHVNVVNDSAVDVTHFNSKLIREITLVAHGHRQVFRDIVCMQKYPGTPTMSKKETDIPLPLIGKRNKIVKPATRGSHVTCTYNMMIEMAVPWAPDIEIYSPVEIYAPQSQAWSQWQPPAWISQAQPQVVCAQIAVPMEIMATQFQRPDFYAPPPQIKVELPMPTVSLALNDQNFNVKVTEQSPLLG